MFKDQIGYLNVGININYLLRAPSYIDSTAPRYPSPTNQRHIVKLFFYSQGGVHEDYWPEDRIANIGIDFGGKV